MGIEDDDRHPQPGAGEDTDVEFVEDVDWLEDADGTPYFLLHGVRYELGEDGYAYPVVPAGPDLDEVDGGLETGLGDTGQGQGGGAGTSATSTVGSDHPPSPFSREAEEARRATSSGVDPDEVWPTDDHTEEVPKVDVRSGASGAGATGVGGDGAAQPLLSLSGVTSGYGNLPVLHGVDLAIRPGETAVLLGLNGAGKTTTALNICGALRTWGGTITFDGQDITRWSIKRAVDAGIVMVPEGRRVFPELSVGRNLQIGAWTQRKDPDWVDEQRHRVFAYFPRLEERVDQLAGTLSGGEQQMLAIARGLMARPRLLIIDEASMGLAPVIVRDVFEIVAQISQDGTTVLMIEQNVGALDVADVGYVMEQGRMVRELRGDDLRDRSKVSEVLMG